MLFCNVWYIYVHERKENEYIFSSFCGLCTSFCAFLYMEVRSIYGVHITSFAVVLLLPTLAAALLLSLGHAIVAIVGRTGVGVALGVGGVVHGVVVHDRCSVLIMLVVDVDVRSVVIDLSDASFSSSALYIYVCTCTW